MYFQGKIEEGNPEPLGTSIRGDGVNFALFSKHAAHVTLCLLDVSSQELIAEVPLDPILNRTGNVWHVCLCDITLPILYGYRVDGPRENPYFFSPEHLLSDPYAQCVHTTRTWNDISEEYTPYSYLTQKTPFDWQGVRHPLIPPKDLIIYEMHVRGFTQAPSSGVKAPGTFLGIIEKIPHLVDLGINAVELLPICEFNEREYDKTNPETGEKLFNYWGYSTVNFFSPMNRYAEDNGIPVAEQFKTMVRELHRNGIEIILDMVFNHTAEKGGNGSTYSFLGIDRVSYRLIDAEGHDENFTGCGHTMRLNHPVMRELVIDCLRYWYTEMQVDGFRFDLASIMNRTINGKVVTNSPLVEAIQLDPVLADAKIIAEPWDCAMTYQLGKFSGNGKRWKEWNGLFRDDIRSFVKNDPHSKNIAATRICGSEDIFYKTTPLSSINFITAHDGFTLTDLVSYNEKHNLANGEENQDGNNYNLSWNCGVEGQTDDIEINAVRRRQIKNFILILMISQGIPMIVMGDEVGHTRAGNNNPWCQDNALNWFPWERMHDEMEIYQFFKFIIQLRKENHNIFSGRFLRKSTIHFHGEEPESPNWDDPSSFLAFTLYDKHMLKHLYIVLNQTGEERTITLPKLPSKRKWYRTVDTSDSSYEPVIIESHYAVKSFSCVILKAI